MALDVSLLGFALSKNFIEQAKRVILTGIIFQLRWFVQGGLGFVDPRLNFFSAIVKPKIHHRHHDDRQHYAPPAATATTAAATTSTTAAASFFPVEQVTPISKTLLTKVWLKLKSKAGFLKIRSTQWFSNEFNHSCWPSWRHEKSPNMKKPSKPNLT